MLKNIWIALFLSVLIWSGVSPKDSFTWALEVFPALVGCVVLGATYHSFRLTPLLYTLILIHSIILMVGGHYTYAEVPLFDALSELLGSERNNYDKVGHFAQGLVPALITREVILRKNIVNGRIWQTVFILSFCLAFSALYELFEWWVALASGANADAFLGTQGYVWDTQSDMAMALLGAIVGLSCLSALHNRQLKRLSGES